jgi:hypothetical protein
VIGCFGTTAHGATIAVGTVSELRRAVATANASPENTTILLQDGTYSLDDTLYVNAPGITIAGNPGDRTRVVIQGDAMSDSARVKNLIRVSGSDFQVRDLTLQKSGWHLIQIAGERNADNTIVRNVIFQDAYQQMLKVTIDQRKYDITGDNGLVEDSLFEYTAGVGPQYYIGGIDVHGGKNWVVRNNLFRAIISPSQTVAEFAIHFWNRSADTIVERNTILNCDRAIGFGLDGRGNSRGIIRNNMIYHKGNIGQFADVGIYLEQSPATQVYNNTIIMEHSYPHSIEYRSPETIDVLIVNNLTNRPISPRDGASGTLGFNNVSATPAWFVDPTAGDLHLAAANTAVVDVGQVVPGLFGDYDGDQRPQGGGIDIGADEWLVSASSPLPGPTNLRFLP